jgi:hypothetical protein
MAFDVIIPWRSGCPYRKLILDWIVNAHDSFGRNVILGELDPDEEWSKARAVQAGLKQSTADEVVVSDGDVWVESVELGLDHLGDVGWAMPFLDVHRLDPGATSTALQTGDLGGKLQQRPYRGVPGGGLIIITRELYDRVPLDPRFVGWGQEDEAWGAALATVAGKGWRGTDRLFHLWHPPQQRQNRAVGSEQSRHLRNLYLKARREGAEMEALLDGARCLLRADASV